MPLIEFNIYIIVMFAIMHIVIKPILKKRYPFKFAGSVLVGILIVLIYDLVPLACYLLIKLYNYIN